MSKRSEVKAASERISRLFSGCPGDNSHEPHRWNLETGKCEKCDAPYPYCDETSQEKKR